MMPETLRDVLIFITGGIFMFALILLSALFRKYQVGLACRELLAGYNQPDHESFHNRLPIRILRMILATIIVLAIGNSFYMMFTGSL